MNVNFEFLGNEPIENVITCMNYQIDKVVYFGYHEIFAKMKACTEKFLKTCCGVGRVVFHPLSHNDLQSVLAAMRRQIELELGQKNHIYFDITGGEDLLLVAFGMLSREFRLPIHLYDVTQNRIYDLDNGAHHPLDEEVPRREFHMDLDKWITMMGGTINARLQKSMKAEGAEENADDIAALWEISERYAEYWNSFSEFLRTYFIPDRDLQARTRTLRVLEGLYTSNSSLSEITLLYKILDDLADAGILEDLERTEEYIAFRFKNETIREILWDAGSILELHIYQEEKPLNDDCCAGVHLDWDGVIRWPDETDVQNEIDVLTVKGNVPTFISCKGGRMNPSMTLRALYELQTVAERFGGQYARKVLVVRHDIGRTYADRAREMDIEVRRI